MDAPPEESRGEAKKLFLYLLLPALLLRILNLTLCAPDPLVRFPFQDGLSYAKWALSISQGDWAGLTRPVFYQAPLYPYLLAVQLGVGLGFFPWPQVFNLTAGTATVALVFLTARRLFGSRAAWWAGGMAAVWGPALMYELLLDKVACGLFVTTLGLWLLVDLDSRLRNGDGGTRRRALLIGLTLGAGALLRENLLVLAPAAAALLYFRQRSPRVPLLLLGGAALGILPAFTHNLLVGGELMPTSYQAGTNFWIGNHEGADGTYQPLRAGRGDPIHEEKDARLLAAVALGIPEERIRPGAVSRYWWRRGLGFLASNPGKWLGLMLTKLQCFVFHEEAPDSVAYSAFRTGRPWLLPTRLLAGLVLPLALLGAWLARRHPGARFGMWLALAALGSVLAFYVVSRYRLACLPFLFPFAAHALLRLRTEPRLAWLLLVLLLPSQLWCLAPSRPEGLGSAQLMALNQVNRGTALSLWTQDGDRAVRAFVKALEFRPDCLAAHRSLGRLWLKAGRVAEALPHCEAEVRLAPEDAEAWHNLGFAQRRSGDLAAAEESFREALRLSGDEPPQMTLEQLALCLRKQGRSKEARALLDGYGGKARPGR
ncbi:MAG: tetratricopeptide repeat protein [Planctomycetota bacterium]